MEKLDLESFIQLERDKSYIRGYTRGMIDADDEYNCQNCKNELDDKIAIGISNIKLYSDEMKNLDDKEVIFRSISLVESIMKAAAQRRCDDG